MRLTVNCLFIALLGLSTSLTYASPIVNLVQSIPGMPAIQGLITQSIPGLHVVQNLIGQGIPGLSTIQSMLAPLGLLNPSVNSDADIGHSYESEGHEYPIILAKPELHETAVVVPNKKYGPLLKMIHFLWSNSRKSHKKLQKTKEIVKTDPVIVKQNVPVYITKHVAVPQPYPVTKTVLKEVNVPQPYPVTNTVLKQVPIPQPYPVTKTIVKEVKVPQPYPVTNTVLKQVPVPQPYPVTKTLIKEVPVVHKVKEYVPFKISVPEPVAVPFVKTVEQHHLLQPIVEQKTIIENHPPPQLSTTSTPPTPSSTEPEPEPELVVEDDKALVSPTVPITEKSIEVITPPPTPVLEYGLPPVKSFQPFNEYELPVHETNFHSSNFGKPGGDYVSSYVLKDGTKVSEEGHLIKGSMGNDVLVKKGNYEFTDKNGKEVKVDWVADELGFRVLNEK